VGYVTPFWYCGPLELRRLNHVRVAKDIRLQSQRFGFMVPARRDTRHLLLLRMLAYHSPVIYVTFSMGHSEGSLSAQVKNLAKSLFDYWSGGALDLRKLKAVTEVDGADNDKIDLMSELISERKELPLPDNDPQMSFEVRSVFLKRFMQENA